MMPLRIRRLPYPEIVMSPYKTALLIIAFLIAQSNAIAASPEPIGADVDVIAKLAKEKAKRHGRDGNQYATTGVNGGDDVPCGNVDIGNFVSGNKGGRGPKEITVVITGDVINANNKCK
jgi:hypothetical protein